MQKESDLCNHDYGICYAAFVSATQGRDIQRIYGQFCGGL